MTHIIVATAVAILSGYCSTGSAAFGFCYWE